MKESLILALGILVVILSWQNQSVLEEKDSYKERLRETQFMQKDDWANNSRLLSAYESGLKKCNKLK